MSFRVIEELAVGAEKRVALVKIEGENGLEVRFEDSREDSKNAEPCLTLKTAKGAILSKCTTFG